MKAKRNTKPLLMKEGAIKYNEFGAYICSLCPNVIPERKTSRNTTELLEWCSYEVEGLFCSELCAQLASSDPIYISIYSYDKEVNA
jgi:hypothetical protein